MTKEQFISLASELFISREKYMEAVKKIADSGAIKFDTLPDNYAAVYPTAHAIYQRLTGWYATGSCIEAQRRKELKESKRLQRTLFYGGV